MAWTSLIGNTNKINNLPKILCGPMLRRVDKKSVSVFLVFKDKIEARLEVYTTQDGNYYDDINVAARSSIIDTYTKPEKLGTNLYAICLTAKIDLGANVELSAQNIYYYDLIFKTSSGFVRLKESTNNEYLQGNMGSLTIASESLPSLMLPDNDFNYLKLLHASCRKPHGYSKDGLSAAYTILETTVNNIHSRPQMLFLTGDQIYADDVSAILLKMIRDAQYALMGWHEELPSISGNYNLSDTNYNQSTDPILQGKRGNTIVNTANFTVEENVAQSHLMTMGEFFMMYIFAWSSSLWQDEFPSFEEVYPGKSKTMVTSIGYGARVSIQNVDTDIYKDYKERKQNLDNFKDCLDEVKKLFANIPTYMILDDHEITDDLFMTAEWCLNTIGTNGSSLGKRIITNGLTAYSIFQDWGNNPLNIMDRDVLFEAIEAVSDGHTEFWDNISTLVLPYIFDITSEQFNEGYYLNKSLFRFEYILPFDNFEVIVLDTRCYRGYKTLNSYPKLISTQRMELVLNNLINPYSTNNKVSVIITPSPLYSSKLVNDLKYFKQMYSGDKEDWEFNFSSQLMFLSKLLKRSKDYSPQNLTSINHKVVFLSGDVHYAFSKQIQMYVHNKSYDFNHNDSSHNNRVNNGSLFAAILCASSLRNEVSGLTGSTFMNFPFFNPLPVIQSINIEDVTNYAIKKTSLVNGFVNGYDLHLAVLHNFRNKDHLSKIELPIKFNKYDEYVEALKEHLKEFILPDPYIGFNNLGEVTFKNNSSSELEFALHRLHYWKHGKDTVNIESNLYEIKLMQ